MQDTQQQKEQALKPDMGNLKLRKPKPVSKLENGKGHEESQVKTEFTNVWANTHFEMQTENENWNPWRDYDSTVVYSSFQGPGVL